MAKDMADRNRWISGIDYFRKEYLKLNNLPGLANSMPPPPLPASQRQLTNLRRNTKKL